MANKTAKEILENCYSLRFHTEASRQLYEAELERIGEDEDVAEAIRLSDTWAQMRLIRNDYRAELRAKARAFYGITETEEEGTE